MPRSKKRVSENQNDSLQKVVKFKKKTSSKDVLENTPHHPVMNNLKGGHSQTSSGDDHLPNEGGHSQGAVGLNHSPASEGGHSQASSIRNKQYGNKGRYGI